LNRFEIVRAINMILEDNITKNLDLARGCEIATMGVQLEKNNNF